jgi:hypothetical protein
VGRGGGKKGTCKHCLELCNVKSLCHVFNINGSLIEERRRELRKGDRRRGKRREVDIFLSTCKDCLELLHSVKSLCHVFNISGMNWLSYDYLAHRDPFLMKIKENKEKIVQIKKYMSSSMIKN